MTRKFAQTTTVPTEQSRAAIEKLLREYGATGFVSGWQGNAEMIGFELCDRHVRFFVPMPAQDDPQFTQVKVNAHSSKTASPDKAKQAWEQEKRRRWRELVAILKAKLIAAQSAVEVFEIPLQVSVEREFMANIVVPETGQTVGEWLQPQLADAYAIGKAISLLPGSKS